MNNTKEIAWDLSELFESTLDPEIDVTLTDLDQMSVEIEKEYRNSINSRDFSSTKLKKLLQKMESFYTEFKSLELFAHLSFVANMTSSANQTLLNKFQHFKTKFSKKLAFIDLEIGTLLEKNPDLVQSIELTNYLHYLERVQRDFSHKLSETEEKLIFEKDQHGINSWAELQSKWLNSRKFEINVEGVQKILSYNESIVLLQHPDRETRTSACKAIYKLLEKENEIFSAAIRNMCGDWVQNSQRRNYDTPMHQSLILNDVTQKTIECLMDLVKNNVQIYQKFLNLKARLLHLNKLGGEDILAPIPGSPNMKYSWKMSKGLILEAYGKFDDEFKNIVENFYTKNHIDAAPRNGKKDAAFCNSWHKGKYGFVLQTFSGTLMDLFTLTHELGHGLHYYLISQNQTFLNIDVPMAVAEVGSIFGELLLGDLLLEKAASPQEKISILTNTLDRAGVAIFHVSARFWFEENLYKLVENGTFLDGETIAKHWTNARDGVYGETVNWSDEIKWVWATKQHYFIPNYRFYNYPYIFAQLFVYALYRVYKQEGKGFIPKFKTILESGSSISPKQMGEIVGFDITDAKFWNYGLQQYEIYLNQLEHLLEEEGTLL